MATPVFLPGRRVLLQRSNDGTATNVTFLGIATARDLKQTKNFADTTAPDDVSPTNVPNRKSVVTSKEWSLNFSGMLDATKRSNLQADFDSEDAVKYRLEIIPESGLNKGYYFGAIHIESLDFGAAYKDMVSFTITARGEDALTWTDE